MISAQVIKGLLPDVITYTQWSCRGRTVVLRHDQAVGSQPNVVTYRAVFNPVKVREANGSTPDVRWRLLDCASPHRTRPQYSGSH